LCLIVAASVAWPAGAADGEPVKAETARLKAVFVSIPANAAAKIRSVLQEKCPTIEFVQTEIAPPVAGGDAPATAKGDPRETLDGLMLFCGGVLDERYWSAGLPAILVNCLPPSRTADFSGIVDAARRSNAKFITAACRADAVEGPSASELDALAEKAKLLGVLKRLKSSKLITVQDHDGINRIDQGVYYEAPLQDYDRQYPGLLKERLGVAMIVVRSDELAREVAKIPVGEAEKIAQMWVEEATEVKNVKPHDILRAAKSYLGQRELLRKYDADALTLDTASLTFKAYGTDKMRGFGIVPESQPLTIMELSKEHIPCCCQSHIDCLVTQMIGQYISGGSGFAGDFLNDWAFPPTGDRPKNVMIVAHCGAPITPLGHEKLPYLIRDHIHNTAFGSENTPTGTTVAWPTHEAASIVKFDVYRNQVSVFEGEVLDGNALYEDFPNRICRNKIVIQIAEPQNCYMLPSNPKAGAFRQCDHWDRKHRHWGGHQVAFYGHLKQAITDLAALTGFEVVDSR
jgi:hypothetical protein